VAVNTFHLDTVLYNVIRFNSGKWC